MVLIFRVLRHTASGILHNSQIPRNLGQWCFQQPLKWECWLGFEIEKDFSLFDPCLGTRDWQDFTRNKTLLLCRMQLISTRDWTLRDLLRQGFLPVPRSSFKSEGLESQIKRHEEFGVPFIIEGWHKHHRWSEEIFSIDFCLQYFQGKNESAPILNTGFKFLSFWSLTEINVRNVHTRQDQVMPFGYFVEKSRSMTYVEPEGMTPVSLHCSRTNVK